MLRTICLGTCVALLPACSQDVDRLRRPVTTDITAGCSSVFSSYGDAYINRHMQVAGRINTGTGNETTLLTPSLSSMTTTSPAYCSGSALIHGVNIHQLWVSALSPPSGVTVFSEPLGMNDLGAVVGQARVDNSHWHPFFFARTGRNGTPQNFLLDLITAGAPAPLACPLSGYATGISEVNGSGEVVVSGFSTLGYEDEWHNCISLGNAAMRWRLSYDSNNDTWSYDGADVLEMYAVARGVGSTGQIAGDDPNGVAAVFDSTTQLDTQISQGNAVASATGQVFGEFKDSSYVSHAAVWTPGMGSWTRTDLPERASPSSSRVKAVSPDGTFAVGEDGGLGVAWVQRTSGCGAGNFIEVVLPNVVTASDVAQIQQPVDMGTVTTYQISGADGFGDIHLVDAPDVSGCSCMATLCTYQATTPTAVGEAFPFSNP